MNILLNGICGHMGREVVKLAEIGYRGANLAVGVDPSSDGSEAPLSVKSFKDIIEINNVDCIVDFSHHSCVSELLDFAVENNIPTVVATTGHTPEEIAKIHEAAKCIPVFFSANMSLGVALLVELAKTAAKSMPDAEIEIVEQHHNRKIDSPSGTALLLADSMNEALNNEMNYEYNRHAKREKRSKKEIGIHAVRGGTEVGKHTVIFFGDNESFEITHNCTSRSVFARGSIKAAEFVLHKENGLYSMNDMI